MTNAAKPIRIFRPGTFTSVEGVVVSFGTDELGAIASAYNAQAGVDPAPLVVGHPRLDDPAYGWVDTLAVEGDVLVAHPSRVEPAFAELVNAGRYPKVSAQFYPPDNPNNPAPGSWYLKHVGFLGAHAPGVKGLGTVSLGDSADGLLTFDFDNPHTQPLDKETIVSTTEDKNNASFAERVAALDAREADIKAREEASAKAAAQAAHDANVSFAETLVAAGKLGKAGSDYLVIALDGLADKAEPVSFGEGDGAVSITPAAALRKLFDGAKPLVSLGEHAPASKKGADIDPHALAREAASFAEAETKAGRPTTVAQAVRHFSAKID